MRLIDADRLKRQVEGRSWRAKGKMVELIDDSPTIEAEPVKHGRWYRPEGWPKKTYKRKCTHCQGVAYFCGNGDYMYCPNCGAKMDLEGETHEQN